MHTRPISTRIVTLVTLLAMFAFGATSAFGAGACVQHEAQSSTQSQHHEHDSGEHDSGTTTPCQHAALGGLCTSATLPSESAAFSSGSPTPVLVRLSDVQYPHFIAVTAVFHPPRF
ncbi:MAG TPA: hypothetical protein VGD27_01720 [Longimicrobiales bacterium]